MTHIYVGDTLVDLYPNTVIALTFSATNLGDVKSRGASYTNAVKIPKSENNRRIFGYADNEKTTASIIYTNISCRVLIDGVLIPEMNVLYLTGSGDSYEMSIYTNEVDMLGALNSPLCSELDFGVSEVLDDTFVTSYRTGSADFVAAVLDYGKGISAQILKPETFNSEKWKVVERSRLEPCRLATTGNKTLSGLSAVDGYTPINGDRILVWQQSTASENGVYIADSGTWTRAADFVQIANVRDIGVYIQSGSTYSQYWFTQTALSGNFVFSSALASGQQAFTWDRPKTAIGSFNGRVPYSSYLEREFPLASVPNIFASETWDFSIDWNVTVLSGTPGVYLRMYLRKNDGSLVNVIDDFANTTTPRTATGSASALDSYTHIVFATIINTDNGSVWPSVEITNPIDITYTDIVPNIKADWNLPCIKFYRAIEEILDSLGTNTIEYPNSDSSYFESLLLTYSREYYGYYDKTAITESSSINLSKFILPDISQKSLLIEWLYRTYSLIRVKEGVIELKPVYNIIKDKVTNAVDWTSKRVRATDPIGFINSQYGQTNYFEDVNTESDLRIVQNDKVTPEPVISNKGTFTIADTRLPEDVTVYKSILSSSQIRESYDGTNKTYAPVYNAFSLDRFDFKTKPKLRVLEGFAGGAFAPDIYIEEVSQTGAMYTTYRYLATTLRGANWDAAVLKSYSNYVEAIQQTKVIERSYILTAIDISELDLFKPIYDDGSYFLIDKVSNYVQGKPTKVTLLKI